MENQTFTSITGGYIHTQTLIKEEGSLKFTPNLAVGAFCTKNIIDLTNYSKLYFKMKISGLEGYYLQTLRFGISDDGTCPTQIVAWTDEMFTTLVKIEKDNPEYADYLVPINDVSKGYIKLGAYATVTINKIWLE